MPLDVVLGAGRFVVLEHAAENGSGGGERPRPPGRAIAANIDEQQREKIQDAADFDIVTAVHVLLAELQLGIEEHGALGRRRIEADAHQSTGIVAETVGHAGPVDDVKPAFLDRPGEERMQKAIYSTVPLSSRYWRVRGAGTGHVAEKPVDARLSVAELYLGHFTFPYAMRSSHTEFTHSEGRSHSDQAATAARSARGNRRNDVTAREIFRGTNRKLH